MKKAFTFYEVIIVIVVLGILAAVVFPRLGTDNLHKAATTFIETLRYAQHLAMIDDKYIATTDLSNFSNAIQRKKETRQWFKKWWCFYVWDKDGSSTSQYGRGPALVVFSDNPSTNDNYRFNNNPSQTETARDPATGKLLSGHEFDSGFEGEINTRYNLYDSYGIEKVVIQTPCTISNKIVFDEIGRPHCQQSTDSTNLIPYNQAINSQVVFTLCRNGSCDENISICLEPHTGFAHICP